VKILIVNVLYTPYKIGGAEKSVQLLSEGLVRGGDEVTVVTLHEHAHEDTGDVNGVRVIRLPMDNIYWPYGGADVSRSLPQRLRWHHRNSWNRAAAARIGRVLDAEKPDVVHCHIITGFSVSIWDEVKKRGIPLVQTLRDYSVMCTRASLFKYGNTCEQRCLECKVLTAPAKRASARVDQLVSNSDYVIRAHHGHDYFPGVPARRIFNVVPLDEKPREPKAADDPLVFGFIGRVEAEKGIDVVLEAIARLDRDDWRLKIAGVGVPAYVDALKARYPDPRIEWLGFSKADDFYRSIDTVLISSVWGEPLPRTLIESLSFKLSAICADAGGIPEIADLARHSITYKPTDADALAAAMRTAIDAKADWRAGGLSDDDALGWFEEKRIVGLNRAAYVDAIAGTK
jgi:glycosyltransferase involved in cell wall biosynthesis